MSASTISFSALEGVPEIQSGDDLADVIATALTANGITLRAYDVVAVAQKIVSKAEGRYLRLDSIEPSDRAREMAITCAKDPRFVEAVLRESTEVVRCVRDVLIVRHRLGFVVANAGVDQSNIVDAGEHVLLLPADPDASAARLRAALHARFAVPLAVIVTDSFGRPWRVGVCGTAIGCAGLAALVDMRGKADRFGRALRITQVAVADEIAAAATLAMGEADEGRPIAIVSGVAREFFSEDASARALIRPAGLDLFR